MTGQAAGRAGPEFRVRRVFNNSAVLAVDADGDECVLLGKGIGYHLHPNDPVDAALIDRTFVLTKRDAIARYSPLLEEVSDEELDLAREVMALARSTLGEHIRPHIFLPLVDHIAFAVRRARENAQPIDYDLRWEVQHLYPDEVAFSHRVIDLVAERLGAAVPRQEAIPLSLHFVNARLASSDMRRTIKVTRVLGRILVAVEEALGIDVDEDSIDVARLVSHLRYLAGGQLSLAPVPDSVHEAVRTSQPAEYQVACQISAILAEEVGSPMNPQETIYLTLHINRLRVASQERQAAAGQFPPRRRDAEPEG